MPTRGDLSTNTQPTAANFGTGGDWFAQNAPSGGGSSVYSGGLFAGGGATGVGSAGGWNDPNVITPSAQVLAQAFQQGLTGQAAVDWATAHGAPNISYDPQHNQFGLPDGAYVAPNPQNPQTFDLISRGGGGGASGGALGGNLSPSEVMAQDPGYQFQLGQGLDAVQRSAAARGTLLTGGTLKDLNAYAQGLAGTSFGNVFNRNLQLAQLGENAAALQGNAGQNYAAQTGNLFTNQGNANAAATVGGANAFNSAIGPITNSATDIYNYYHNPNNTSSYQSSLPYQNYFGTPYGQGPIPG